MKRAENVFFREKDTSMQKSHMPPTMCVSPSSLLPTQLLLLFLSLTPPHAARCLLPPKILSQLPKTQN